MNGQETGKVKKGKRIFRKNNRKSKVQKNKVRKEQSIEIKIEIKELQKIKGKNKKTIKRKM